MGKTLGGFEVLNRKLKLLLSARLRNFDAAVQEHEDELEELHSKITQAALAQNQEHVAELEKERLAISKTIGDAAFAAAIEAETIWDKMKGDRTILSRQPSRQPSAAN